ncbi:Nucleolar GTP-binding protein 1 [Platanthera zijinensis]|uniref:Nucleolar GTP-binding protein 1 n=1 Tax=Platanthera zijinensis TaxID=2320716 RepID=A0AAP0AY40_9ASPA
MNKPLIIVCNKIDLQPLDSLSEEDMKSVMEMKSEAMKTVVAQGGEPNDEGVLLSMSTSTDDGVIAVKNSACERILNQRVVLKMKSKKRKVLAEIRQRKSSLIQEHKIKKSTAESRPAVPRKFDKDRKFTTSRMGRHLSGLGLDPSAAIDRARSRSLSLGGDERGRDRWWQTAKKPWISMTNTRARKKAARRGEADRVIPSLKPKHLFSGKRSSGKILCLILFLC